MFNNFIFISPLSDNDIWYTDDSKIDTSTNVGSAVSVIKHTSSVHKGNFQLFFMLRYCSQV